MKSLGISRAIEVLDEYVFNSRTYLTVSDKCGLFTHLSKILRSDNIILIEEFEEMKIYEVERSTFNQIYVELLNYVNPLLEHVHLIQDDHLNNYSHNKKSMTFTFNLN